MDVGQQAQAPLRTHVGEHLQPLLQAGAAKRRKGGAVGLVERGLEDDVGPQRPVDGNEAFGYRVEQFGRFNHAGTSDEFGFHRNKYNTKSRIRQIYSPRSACNFTRSVLPRRIRPACEAGGTAAVEARRAEARRGHGGSTAEARRRHGEACSKRTVPTALPIRPQDGIRPAQPSSVRSGSVRSNSVQSRPVRAQKKASPLPYGEETPPICYKSGPCRGTNPVRKPHSEIDTPESSRRGTTATATSGQSGPGTPRRAPNLRACRCRWSPRR